MMEKEIVSRTGVNMIKIGEHRINPIKRIGKRYIHMKIATIHISRFFIFTI
tara:strand:- start:166 stop:318 length:153 start_codon:yes stop_codon:yes gene_type:complete